MDYNSRLLHYDNLNTIHFPYFTIILDLACKKSPCHLNASCENVPGGYKCTCDPEFIGNGTHCQTGKNYIYRSEYHYTHTDCTIRIISRINIIQKMVLTSFLSVIL